MFMLTVVVYLSNSLNNEIMLSYSQKFNVFDNNVAAKPINLLVGGTFNAMNYKD